MYCQKCRTPLNIDSSLDNLNPAAFDLLIGSAVKSQQTVSSYRKLDYPVERKVLYDKVSVQAAPPLHKRIIPPPRPDDGDNKNIDSHIQAPEMSFFEVTRSQVVASDNSKTPRSTPPARKPDIDDGKDGLEGADHLSMADKVKKNEKLFAILSAHSDIDHPTCMDCTSILLQSYTARLASATRERDAYAGFLKQLQQSAAANTGDEDDNAKTDKILAQLKLEDEEAYRELLLLEKEKAELEAELADLEEESRALDEEERSFWADRNAFDDELHALKSDLASLQLKIYQDERQLEKLQRTNVYNDTFCIGHDGSFATINGLRLGRLPGHKLEWAEINAAFGQTLLLLATVAGRLKYVFEGYRLKPMGSTSRIEKIEYPQRAPTASQTGSAGNQRPKNDLPPGQPKITPLDLFSSGETALGRLLIYQKFDNGLAAFLDCLAQLGDHVTKLPAGGEQSRNAPPKAVFPYKISGDKIGNDKAGYASIKLGVGFQQQQDENFTRACKYALTCCKFLLAHLSAMDS